METNIASLKQDLANHENEISMIDSNIDLNAKAEQIIKKISKEVSEKFLGNLQSLMNDALSLVFTDRDYKVEIEVIEKRGNNQIHFFLLEKIGDNVVRSRVREDVGAGVMCIIGLIFQVYYINTVNLKRALIIDEAFTELSDEYIENFFTLLRQLKESFGFVFLIITHDVRFHEYADRIYRIDRGKVKEVPLGKEAV